MLTALPADDAEWASCDPACARRACGDQEPRLGAADDPLLDAAHGLGAQLSAHVRYEERELFPLLEGRLSHEALAGLGRAVSDAEAGH